MSPAMQKLLQDYADQMWMNANPFDLTQRHTATQIMLQQQALARQVYLLQNQIGAQPHGRNWPPPQALHGSSPGVPGSGAGGGAGGPITSALAAIRAHESAPPAIEEAGIRAGEIIAWRVWRLERREKIVFKQPLKPLPYVSRDRLAPAKYEQEVVPATPFLRSTYKHTVWEPGQTMEAHADPVTQRYDQETRSSAAFVGIFAWKTLGALSSYVQTQFARVRDPWAMQVFEPELLIIGQVALWGSVIEHEHGYRAQFAKPHRLFMVCDADGNSFNEPLRLELCRLYGLPEEGV